ncbi:MAG: hypothetical protein JSW13_02215 [Candidatus Aerophobus sp.]|nr:MAG: hypothetical protein JSW13_02215 [Candidatus Aerophobus sp.]
MGVKMNFVLSIVALVIAIVGCVLAVRVSFFQPALLSEEKVIAMIETSMKNRVTEERVLEIIKEKIAEIKPLAPEEKAPE